MYFKRLELVGFKSFCDKTTLNFEPGITAVVGPNGCGKSNIFDSIRWVLGEQSAKSLRGSEMQDVIFNGTDSKEPVGMAEVSLTFDNEKRFFNIEHPEVVITRRLFRSGESEYLLNKSPVRLKDILDLLLGTGIGAESYSIVAQGKIDLVLSSRPEDRRLVFDEAAGITKYKSQKRETLRKLEETDQNLLRINDIITEVKRQIASLERQANKARRYKEVFEELKSKEVNLSFWQKAQILAEKDRIISELKALEIEEAQVLETLRLQEAKIANRQAELKSLEDSMMDIKNQILCLENMVVRNNERISFNNEKIMELSENNDYLVAQALQVKEKLKFDEEQLNKVAAEYDSIKKNIEEKSLSLSEKESQINVINSSIKHSLELIAGSKRNILELAAKISNTKNEISDFNAKQQIYLARKKRLEIEKTKICEEKLQVETSLNCVTQEVEAAKRIVDDLSLKLSGAKGELQQENLNLNNICLSIDDLEKQKLTLVSNKDFLEKLKTKYEDIGESLNAVIYLDRLPSQQLSGLVVKVIENCALSDEDRSYFNSANFKISGEAKPIELDTKNIEEKIKALEERICASKGEKTVKESRLEEINKIINDLNQEFRSQEISLSNKETSRATISEQFTKTKEEEDLIIIELSDASREMSVLEKNAQFSIVKLEELNKEHRLTEDTIGAQEDSILANNKSREELLVVITKTKAELDALNRKIGSDEVTLKILEDTFKQDKDSISNIENRLKDNEAKKESFLKEIIDCQNASQVSDQDIQVKNDSLKALEASYKQASEGTAEVTKNIESGRLTLDNLKNSLYELQMCNKDIDYKYSGLKERMLQAYKIDLECQQAVAIEIDAVVLGQGIEVLKQKLDSYGSVNLVAIEEYDELKKRYDFLVQQQADLVSAKEALHQAILKINRTTKQMFMETFERVREEFKNYFRLLFNGGDAQVFLTDEQDPLESGIEIICRPPGKKLQNVLLLSGGEKSMSAIALVFAIFKVKPSPFCILDEIDAALDEANVSRFSRILQEFVKQSQFIVITHNKRTIANANVMYGITMQQSGVSRIVSVKFSEDAPKESKEVVPAVSVP